MENTYLLPDDIKQDVLTNPRYAEFFAPYHPKVAESFAQRYAYHKYEWLQKGERADAEQTYAAGWFAEMAYNRLWGHSAQKNCFDLQCRWRAGAGIDARIELHA